MGLWRGEKPRGNSQLGLTRSRTDWTQALKWEQWIWSDVMINWHLNNVCVFKLASGQKRNVHFVVQVFGHFEYLKQEHHLPRVLQDFGITLREEALVPAFIGTLRPWAIGGFLSCTEYNTGLTILAWKLQSWSVLVTQGALIPSTARAPLGPSATTTVLLLRLFPSVPSLFLSPLHQAKQKAENCSLCLIHFWSFFYQHWCIFWFQFNFWFWRQ